MFISINQLSTSEHYFLKTFPEFFLFKKYRFRKNRLRRKTIFRILKVIYKSVLFRLDGLELPRALRKNIRSASSSDLPFSHPRINSTIWISKASLIITQTRVICNCWVHKRGRSSHLIAHASRVNGLFIENEGNSLFTVVLVWSFGVVDMYSGDMESAECRGYYVNKLKKKTQFHSKKV